MVRRLHRPSRHVLVATEAMRRELESRGFERTRIWSRGVDIASFAAGTRDARDLPRPIFLYAGRVAPEKGLDAFLSLNLPGCKVVVGDGPDRARLGHPRSAGRTRCVVGRRTRAGGRNRALTRMPRGFATLVSAQFLSALADNTILIIAIALLDARLAPVWMIPFLKFFFIASFVLFAFVVGAYADTRPKARVMLITNGIKGAGCLLLLAGVHPLAAYALIGVGAAANSPARYGLLTELLPPGRLVAANAWLESLTIASVITGTMLGGVLVSPEFAHLIGEPAARTPPALAAAVLIAFGIYAAAATVNLYIPDSCKRYPLPGRARDLAGEFVRALRRLLVDPAGRVALLVTALLWGVGATLQFVVIDWGREGLDLPLDRAAMLPGVVVVGVALGAVLAGRWVRLERAFSIVPLGILFGPLLIAMLPFKSVAIVAALLFVNGIAAGVFIVPMNATLQHRGYVLVNAGQAIAVQNFCENLSVMLMLGLYATLRGLDVALALIVVALGAFVSASMLAIQSHSVRGTAARIQASEVAPETARSKDGF